MEHSKSLAPHTGKVFLKLSPNSPLSQQSYFVTHIVSQFNCDDVITRHNCFLRLPYFDQVVDRIIGTIIDGDFKKELVGRARY